METKFTKGEWKSRGFEAESNGYISVDFPKGSITIYGGVIPNLLGEERDRLIEEAEANAKLIAAAPEMFEVLKSIYDDPETFNDLFGSQQDKIKSALKKATD